MVDSKENETFDLGVKGSNSMLQVIIGKFFTFYDLSIFFQHVPSLVVIVYSFLCILGFLPVILLIMVLSGTIIGWVYLRFYQPRGKGVKGDLSESFSFASFFPEATQ